MDGRVAIIAASFVLEYISTVIPIDSRHTLKYSKMSHCNHPTTLILCSLYIITYILR